MSTRGFGSDNQSGVHPRYLDAIARANSGHAPSYGTDELTASAEKMFKRLFGPETEVHYVFNGTAANVLALGALAHSFEAVLASEHAHIINDECGAPEKSLGCKLISVPSDDAKLTPESLRPYLVRRGDQHASQVRVISITQPTELGTVYTRDEIKALSAFAKKERLFLHMDGSRFVNAVHALGCSFKELSAELGVDALSLGGTKNGMLFGEAVLFFNKELGKDFKYKRKQSMQLPSKTRYLAAQFLEFLGTELWQENARHVCAMAQLLASGLRASPWAELTQTPEANAVFVKFPRQMIAALREQAFFYVWNEASFECRLMMSWDTTPEDIQQFLIKLEALGQSLRA